MDNFLTKFSENPIQFAFAFAIILIAIAIVFRIINPASLITNVFAKLWPGLISELRNESGRAGVINIIMGLFVFILSFVVIVKPSIKSILSLGDVKTFFLCILLIFIDGVIFYASIKLVTQNERAMQYYKNDKSCKSQTNTKTKKK